MENTETLLTPADLPAAQALVAEAGWNQNEADWRIFLDLGRVIALRDAGRLVATAATLPYVGGFGWISMVLVAQSHRRQGIATRLLERCISVLQEAGLIPVLDATPAGREVYRPLGFHDGWPITRWHRAADLLAAAPATTARPLTPRDWPALLALDAQAFGCDRAPLLEQLRERSPRFACAVEQDGRLRGFLLGREGRVATQLGPIVADDERSAAGLVAYACARVAGPLLLDALDRHALLARELETRGFARERPYTRMALGRDDLFGDPARLMAIAGPELG